jgi:tetratricopeptide (TPR) repeat protein
MNLASSPTPSSEWIGESIAESLREALASRGMMVVSRQDLTEAYVTLRLRPGAEITSASALKLGQALSVETVIYGTYRAESSGSLAIDTSVSDRLRSRISAPIQDTGNVTDIDRVEAHLAWQVIRAVVPATAPPEPSAQMLRPPVRASAEESFIRGLLATSPELKERLYQQAAKADAKFARPALELGKIDLARKSYKNAAVWFGRIEPADMHYAEASFYSGVAKFHDGDYVSAQGAFDRITKTLPVAEVFSNLGIVENRLNLSRAVSTFREAVNLDPNNPDYQFNLAYSLFKLGRFDAAADRFRAVLERDPGDQMATLLLGKSIKREGIRSSNTADARFEWAERFKDTYEPPLPRPAAAIRLENK